MSDIPNRQKWDFNFYNQVEFSKDKLERYYTNKMLVKTQHMFEYTNLPDTIPAGDLELMLQTYGSATVAKVNGELYAFKGGLGGMPNVYYRPTISIVANPALKLSKSYTIDSDCVVIRNDNLYQGLLPIIQHASYLLAECDISFKFAAINIRIPAIIDAADAKSKLEAEQFLKQIEDGSKLGVIADSGFEDRLQVYNYANSNDTITNLIELKQYIIGTFYQELGIQSQFNMKREAINEAEAALSTDMLYPLLDTMYAERKNGVDKINKMFGTNITVDFGSVWKQLRETRDLSVDLQESEIIANIGQNDDNEVNNDEEQNI